MATNQLSKFGDLSETTYSDGTGLRYTDSYWGGETGPSARRTGFIPNTPISPIQMNTLFSQTTMCSYILGQVLASDAIKTKAGTSTITDDITSELTQDDANTNYASKFIDFLNRINQISGNGGTGTESVWRSRQIGFNDSSTNFWSVDSSNTLKPTGTSGNLQSKKINATQLIVSQSSSTSSDEDLYVSGDARITNSLATKTLQITNTTGQALTVQGSSTFNTLAEFNAAVNCHKTCHLGTTMSDPIYLAVPSDPPNATTKGANVNIYTKYGRTTYDQQNLIDVLENIGTRLDNLGFSTGTVRVFGQTIGSSSSPSIWRQGNFCYVSVDTVINFSNKPDLSQPIIVLPSGFTPNETQTGIAVIAADNNPILNMYQTGSVQICTLTSGSLNITRSQWANFTADTRWNSNPMRVICHFGYEARPR